MDLRSENLRFLLWQRKGVPREQWVAIAAAWLECSPGRARALLLGRDTIQDDEEQRVLRRADLPAEEFHFSRLAEEGHASILQRNIDYLLGSLEHGRQKELCSALGIDRSTLSRWRKGESSPAPTNQLKLLSFYQLPATTDLKIEALFLRIDPISACERKKDLAERLAKLDDVTLNELYPALKRILEN